MKVTLSNFSLNVVVTQRGFVIQINPIIGDLELDQVAQIWAETDTFMQFLEESRLGSESLLVDGGRSIHFATADGGIANVTITLADGVTVVGEIANKDWLDFVSLCTQNESGL